MAWRNIGGGGSWLAQSWLGIVVASRRK